MEGRGMFEHLSPREKKAFTSILDNKGPYCIGEKYRSGEGAH